MPPTPAGASPGRRPGALPRSPSTSACPTTRAAAILMRHGARTRAALLETMERIACVLNADRIAIFDEDPETRGRAGVPRRLLRRPRKAVRYGLRPRPQPRSRPHGAPRRRSALSWSPAPTGSPVGCCALKGDGGNTGEIKRLWVAPPARGLGLARGLMAAAEARARALGMQRLRLDTNRALTAAIRLYRATGWQEVPAFNAEPYAHHWFEKQLA